MICICELAWKKSARVPVIGTMPATNLSRGMKAALTEWSLLMESSLNGVGMAYKRRASGDEGEGEAHEHTNTCRGCVCSVDAVMTTVMTC